MPFPGSAAASLPDGVRRQRRPYKLDGPPDVALASSNRGRQKRVLGGSGTPSWFRLCAAKKIVSKEYVDYSCPSLGGRPNAAVMNLTAASFSWRHGLVWRYNLYTCSAGRIGPLPVILCAVPFRGGIYPFPVFAQEGIAPAASGRGCCPARPIYIYQGHSEPRELSSLPRLRFIISGIATIWSAGSAVFCR